jgi:hypothetical protein
MNTIFADHLRKFVLVFVDDILVYNKSLEEHQDHLKQVFDILREHKLFVKKSKCTFAQQQLEYLGHIIGEEGVKTDPTKIQAPELAYPIEPETTQRILGPFRILP